MVTASQVLTKALILTIRGGTLVIRAAVNLGKALLGISAVSWHPLTMKVSHSISVS